MKIKYRIDDAFKEMHHLISLEPSRGSLFAAGWDIKSVEDTVVQSMGRTKVRTGLHVEIPDGYVGFVPSRSGMATKHGTFIVNSPGTIDSDYRGELFITLYNSGREPFVVRQGDRIAQLVVVRHEILEFEEGDLSPSIRGTAGLGSTGR